MRDLLGGHFGKCYNVIDETPVPDHDVMTIHVSSNGITLITTNKNIDPIEYQEIVKADIE